MHCLARRVCSVSNVTTLYKLIPGVCSVTASERIFKGCKNAHSASGSALLSCLESRGLVRLHGKDTNDFLQGLVTNDIHELMSKESSIQYSFMLNVQGRILYDLFLYNTTEQDGSPTIFVDLPATGVEEFMTLLKRYKLRKKVDISNISDEFKVWSHFHPHVEGECSYSPEESLLETVISGPDPRVAAFGRRMIRRQSKDEDGHVVAERVYRESRYKWGLPEGQEDLPPGNCFPLESNGVFMNAVSFSKGCYIGQELTARTHHTGVTRKRIMPLVFSGPAPEIERDQNIKNEKGRNAGKFRGSQGCHALGLVRLLHIKDNLTVISRDNNECPLRTHIPNWWPEFTIN